MMFSQEIVVKGKAFNSGKFNNRVVYVVRKDTVNKQIIRNDSLNSTSKKNYSLEDIFKEGEIFRQKQEKKYSIPTDSIGNFELKANLVDTLFFESYAHISEKHLVSDLVKKKNININLKLEPCEVWPSHPERPMKLYVFIGKKIRVWGSIPGYCNSDHLDSRTLAKYEIVKNIYGDFKKDTIQFSSYSHGSLSKENYVPFKTTRFDDYEYCLLYLLEYKGELIQIKYLFDDVYLTKEGKWATPVKRKGQSNSISPDLFKPNKINFIAPIEFEYDKLYGSTAQKEKVIINYGYYVEDLFEIRKSDYLKNYEYLIK